MLKNPSFNLELILPKHQHRWGQTACTALQFICYRGKWSFKLITSERQDKGQLPTKNDPVQLS